MKKQLWDAAPEKKRIRPPSVWITNQEFHEAIEREKKTGRVFCYQEFAPGKARYWFQREGECVQVDTLQLRGKITDVYLPRNA